MGSGISHFLVRIKNGKMGGTEINVHPSAYHPMRFSIIEYHVIWDTAIYACGVYDTGSTPHGDFYRHLLTDSWLREFRRAGDQEKLNRDALWGILASLSSRLLPQDSDVYNFEEPSISSRIFRISQCLDPDLVWGLPTCLWPKVKEKFHIRWWASALLPSATSTLGRIGITMPQSDGRYLLLHSFGLPRESSGWDDYIFIRDTLIRGIWYYILKFTVPKWYYEIFGCTVPESIVTATRECLFVLFCERARMRVDGVPWRADQMLRSTNRWEALTFCNRLIEKPVFMWKSELQRYAEVSMKG